MDDVASTIKAEPKDELSDHENDKNDDSKIEVEQNLASKIEDKKPEKVEEPKVPFNCSNCGFSIDCDYNGKCPPFSKNIKFNDICYVLKDPFSPPPGRTSNKSNSEYFIVIGSNCCRCNKVVCASSTCSLFYQKSYCLDCAHQSISLFPLEVQSKIRKTLATTTTTN